MTNALASLLRYVTICLAVAGFLGLPSFATAGVLATGTGHAISPLPPPDPLDPPPAFISPLPPPDPLDPPPVR